VAAGIADARLVLQTVNMAVTRTGAAVFQFGERRCDTSGKGPETVRFEIRRLEVPDLEAGIRASGSAIFNDSEHRWYPILAPGDLRRQRFDIAHFFDPLSIF
jgi:hypothetical protein